MITQTFKCNFSVSCLLTRHSSIWISNDGIHPSEFPMTAFTAVCHPNYQNLQKVGYDIVIFNGNVLGHSWHTWCKKGTNGKKMSCSLLIGHMQIFKNQLTLEQWAFENGLPLFWYTLYFPLETKHVRQAYTSSLYLAKVGMVTAWNKSVPAWLTCSTVWVYRAILSTCNL